MTIKEHQLQELERYISEGVSCQKAALEGKKKYLYRVQEWLVNICRENKEDEPYWVWFMPVPKFNIGITVKIENDDKFYTNALVLCLQQLNVLRDNYYRQKELEESRAQTKAAIKSLKYAQKSLRITIIGLIVSLCVPIFTNICCTSTIRIDDQQFQQIKALHNIDSIDLRKNDGLPRQQQFTPPTQDGTPCIKHNSAR